MTGYRPPFHINNTMLNYVASITEKLGRLGSSRNLENRPHLRRDNRIRSIHSSLKIEANSLSLEQVTDVVDGKIVLGEQREIQEVKNAYDAYELISEIDPFSTDDLLKMHGIMTRYLLDDAGSYRRGGEGVFDGDICIFMAPPANMVPGLIEQLFSWMKEAFEEGTIHPLILAAVFHYEFVFIHPFADGNGRMARLWHTAILSKWQSIFEYIPIESQIEKFQDGYYQAISRCHVRGNSDIFIEYILKQIDAVLDDITAQLSPGTDSMTEYVKRLISVMEPGIPYTAADIMSRLGLKSKETFRKNYLHPAMGMNLVAMAVPDKPQSRNQRYYRV